MKITTTSSRLFWAGIALFLCFSACDQNRGLSPEDYSPENLLSWNQTIMELAKEKDALLTLNGVRTEAIAFAAAHNALNRITSIYRLIHKQL